MLYRLLKKGLHLSLIFSLISMSLQPAYAGGDRKDKQEEEGAAAPLLSGGSQGYGSGGRELVNRSYLPPVNMPEFLRELEALYPDSYEPPHSAAEGIIVDPEQLALFFKCLIQNRDILGDDDKLDLAFRARMTELLDRFLDRKQAHKDSKSQATQSIPTYASSMTSDQVTHALAIVAEFNDDAMRKSSLFVYDPRKGTKLHGGRKSRHFLHAFDREFFLKQCGSLPAGGLRLAFTLIGGIPSALAVNQLITYGTFDLLSVPMDGPGEAAATLVYTLWVMPITISQWHDMANGMVRWLSDRGPFKPRPKLSMGVRSRQQSGAVENPDEYPSFFAKSGLHKAAEYVVFGVAFAGGLKAIATHLFLAVDVDQKPHRGAYGYPLTVFLGVTVTKLLWDIISPTVDAMFTRYYYPKTQSSVDMRRILVESVQNFLDYINQPGSGADDFINNTFEVADARIREMDEFEDSSGCVFEASGGRWLGERILPFVASLFFLKKGDRVKTTSGSMEFVSPDHLHPPRVGSLQAEVMDADEALQLLKEEKADRDVVKKETWWYSVTQVGSTWLAGAATLFAYETLRYSLALVFTKGSLDSSRAMRCAEILASFLGPSTLALAIPIIQECLYSFSSLFSRSQDKWGLRKLLGFHAASNAVVYSLPGIVVAKLAIGLQSGGQGIAIVSGFAAFFFMNQYIFNRYDQEMLTKLFTTTGCCGRSRNTESVSYRLSMLNYWAKQLILRIQGGQGIRPLKSDSIEDLYNLTQHTWDQDFS